MSRVVLHGELAEKFNPEYNLNVSSTKDAISALCNLVPNFRQTFADGAYYLYVDSGEHLNIDEETFNLCIQGDIHIVPEVIGAKKGGLGKILLGIALIGLAFIPGGQFAAALGSGALGSGTFGAAVGLGASFGQAATLAGLATTVVTNIGISLVLGGAAQMLSPKPPSGGSGGSKDQSYLLHGSDINIQDGSNVPLIYGEVLAAAYPISVEISNDESIPTGTGTGGVVTPGGYITISGWRLEGFSISPS